jgi:2-C-methyl-D-erythritol 4-phosphate cytidylyltransferase
MGVEIPKQFLDLDGVPLVVFTLRRLAACPLIDEFIVATRMDDVASLQDRVSLARLGKPVRVVHGGDSRQESVANALAQAAPHTEIVVVHDAVRPLVTAQQTERVIAEARARGAAILGIPAIDTVKARTHRPGSDAPGLFFRAATGGVREGQGRRCDVVG